MSYSISTWAACVVNFLLARLLGSDIKHVLLLLQVLDANADMAGMPDIYRQCENEVIGGVSL